MKPTLTFGCADFRIFVLLRLRVKAQSSGSGTDASQPSSEPLAHLGLVPSVSSLRPNTDEEDPLELLVMEEPVTTPQQSSGRLAPDGHGATVGVR